MRLDPYEKEILSNLNYFDFNGMLRFFQLDDDMYLLASHEPLNITQPTLFKQHYKWLMPVTTDIEKNIA